MKKNIINLSVILLLVMTLQNCNNNDLSNSQSFAPESGLLIKSINQSFIANNETFRAQSIVSIKNYDFAHYFLQIISYKDESGVERDFGIYKTFYIDSKGVKSYTSGYKVWCTGNCDCALEGIAGEYVQCKCSDCKMHYESTDNMLQFGNKSFKFNVNEEILKFNQSWKSEEIAEVQINIISVKQENYSSNSVVYFEYEGPDLQTKSFAVVYNSETEVAITVDCTGECDCRERFIPATGAIECTCNPCKMVIGGELQE